MFDAVGDVARVEDAEDYGAEGDVEVEGGWWGVNAAVGWGCLFQKG